MSVQALGWVLDHSVAEKGERLVLLSLANHAHADGTDAYPSVATIMKETRLPERNVQYSLKALVEGGHIANMGKAPDERIPGNRRPTNYSILGVPPAAPQEIQGCKNAGSGVQESAPRGAAHRTQTKYLNQEQTAASVVEEEETGPTPVGEAIIAEIKAKLHGKEQDGIKQAETVELPDKPDVLAEAR